MQHTKWITQFKKNMCLYVQVSIYIYICARKYTYTRTDIYIYLYSHTCSELSLRILLWNASYMQKRSGDETRENRGSNHRQIYMTESSAQNKLLTNIR